MVYRIPALSHQDAFIIMDAIRQHAEAHNAGIAIAVTDSHGELLALLRTDGCPLPSINNAQNKAYVASREGIPSGVLGQRALDENFPLTNFGDLRYTGWGGGLPIIVEDVVIGAVGVSGLTSDEDVAYAKHGIAAWDEAR